MTLIAHLSDTHFGTEVPEVVAAVQQALLTARPDIVLISGDITQRAHSSQFLAAKAFMDALPADIKFVIPGNHDIPLFNLPLRMAAPYSTYSHIFGLREGVWCHGDVGIIGYDATDRFRHTRGRLSKNQLATHIARARSQLKPGAILVACAHQPLVTAWPEDQENILIDASETAEIFAANGVDAVLSGHVHVPLIATTQTAFPSLSRHFVLSGAGTAVSHRTRPGAPNSFNLIQIAASATPAITITLMEYAAPAFYTKSETRFGLSPAGWQVLP